MGNCARKAKIDKCIIAFHDVENMVDSSISLPNKYLTKGNDVRDVGNFHYRESNQSYDTTVSYTHLTLPTKA